MSEFTPGPWDIVRRAIGPESGKAQWRVYDQHGIEIAESPVGPQAFNEANGRLIAAAPDLLAALQVALDVLEEVNTSDLAPILGSAIEQQVFDAYRQCENAIAKAEGIPQPA